MWPVMYAVVVGLVAWCTTGMCVVHAAPDSTGSSRWTHGLAARLRGSTFVRPRGSVGPGGLQYGSSSIEATHFGGTTSIFRYRPARGSRDVAIRVTNVKGDLREHNQLYAALSRIGAAPRFHFSATTKDGHGFSVFQWADGPTVMQRLNEHALLPSQGRRVPRLIRKLCWERIVNHDFFFTSVVLDAQHERAVLVDAKDSVLWAGASLARVAFAYQEILQRNGWDMEAPEVQRRVDRWAIGEMVKHVLPGQQFDETSLEEKLLRESPQAAEEHLCVMKAIGVTPESTQVDDLRLRPRVRELLRRESHTEQSIIEPVDFNTGIWRKLAHHPGVPD